MLWGGGGIKICEVGMVQKRLGNTGLDGTLITVPASHKTSYGEGGGVDVQLQASTTVNKSV